MNIFKNAFSSGKNEESLKKIQSLYADLKSWDAGRAKFLKNHLEIIESVMHALDNKVSQVQKYIETLSKIMNNRIEQITTYCKNGVNDSQFFLVPCNLSSMKPSHSLLKHILMEESQRQLTISKKAVVLAQIYERLREIQKKQCSQSRNSQEEEQREGEPVRQLKSSIRFLIDIELQDINNEVVNLCREVSNAQSQNKDFYLIIQKFIKMADKQLKMHNEIGSQLYKLIETFSKRQKQLREELRQILATWIKEDLEDNIFSAQLKKIRPDDLIQDYYDIQTILAGKSELWAGQLLEDFFKNLKIDKFNAHQKLILYHKQTLYNGKIQAKVLITEQKFVYLFRLNNLQPDFTFQISKNIRIVKTSQLSLKIVQWRRVLMVKQETQFEFTLQFNLQNDVRQFIETMAQLNCQIQMNLT